MRGFENHAEREYYERLAERRYAKWVYRVAPDRLWGPYPDIECRMYADWEDQTPSIRAAWIARTIRDCPTPSGDSGE